MLTISLIAFFLISGALAYKTEQRIWNKGICKTNGQVWRRFDTSSQGCRGYVAGDQYCWISWPVDKEPPTC